MDEKNSVRTYKRWLAIVSILLVAVLCAQGVYWARFHGKTAEGTNTEQAIEQQAAEQLSTVTEKPAESADEAGQNTEGEQSASVQPAEETQQEQSATEPSPTEEQTAAEQSPKEEQPTTDRGTLSRDGYTLEQVVIMSRHNIRSPMSGNGSVLQKVTPHEWFEWSSNPSELSLRGGAAETIIGQYFRKWLEKEGLFPENYHPDEGAVRIYANSKQRTIATAEFFMSGLLPTANMQLEYDVEYDTMDPVFNPQLTFVTDEYADDVLAQIYELHSEEIQNLEDNFELIEDVIDFKESEAYKSGEITGFSTDDISFKFEEYKEPATTGSLKTMCSISDALGLQYYEEQDEVKAAFGHELTQDQWREISEAKDVYGGVLFSTPLLSYNVAHPLLQEIRSELTADGREFSFLCGHDSNLASIMTCLRVSDYTLPDTIETTTPIGAKIVFSRWLSPEGEELMSIDLVYSSTEQLRDLSLMDLENPPYVVPLELEGITQTADGLYKVEDVLARFDEAIAEYDRLLEKYGTEEQELDEAA